ncbi:MAG: MerR family transcriptional regulator, partial [Desulfobulbia bacterium]
MPNKPPGAKGLPFVPGEKDGEKTMKENKALFTIGMAAGMLDIHPRTLRNYEEAGLITPHRKGSWRYYSLRDIQWVECLR